MLRAKLKHRGVSNIFHMHVTLEYTETAAVPVVVSPLTENVKSSIVYYAHRFSPFLFVWVKTDSVVTEFYISQNQLYSLLRYV